MLRKILISSFVNCTEEVLEEHYIYIFCTNDFKIDADTLMMRNAKVICF